MIRVASREAASGALEASPVDRRSARVLNRFGEADRPAAFWVTLWVVVAAAEFGALVPVIWSHGEPVEAWQVVFRLIGGSFAACGLIAWHRRPDSRSGAAHDRHGLRLPRRARCSPRSRPALAQTAAIVTSDLWAIPFSALMLTFLTGGRLVSSIDRWAVASFVLPLIILQVVWLLFLEEDGNVLARLPRRADRQRRRQGAARALRARVRVHDRPHRPAVARGLAAPAPRAAAERRGRGGPRPVRRARDERPRHRGAQRRPALAGGHVAGRGPARVPRRAPALAARARRPHRPLPRAAHDARARAPGRAREDARRPGARRRLPHPRPGRLRPVRRRAGHDAAARRAPPHRAGRAQRPRDRRARLRRRRSTTTRSSSRRSSRRRGDRARERAPAGRVRRRASPSCAPRASASSRPATPSAAGSSATSTTARSSGSSRIAMQLRFLQDADPRRPVDGRAARGHARATSSPSPSHELRELARGIHPAVLDHGLEAALESLASRSPVPGHAALRARTSRLPAPVELAGYFVASRGAHERREVRAGDVGLGRA